MFNPLPMAFCIVIYSPSVNVNESRLMILCHHDSDNNLYLGVLRRCFYSELVLITEIWTFSINPYLHGGNGVYKLKYKPL